MLPRQRFLFAATLILLVAALLRLAFLGSIPPGLHYDEGANGVIVRNIAFDSYCPIFIPNYTGKEVLWFYAAGIIMRIIGPTVFALRLTSTLFGLLCVAATGWVVRRLYADDPRRDSLALLAMSIIGVAFWLNILGRFADRAITQPLLQAFSLGLLWMGFTAKSDHARLKWMILAGAATGIAAYTYLAVRLFPLPLIVALLVFLIATPDRFKRLRDVVVLGLAAMVVITPVVIYFLQHPDAFGTRIGQVAPRSFDEALEGWRLALRMFFVSGDPLWRFNIPGKPIFDPILGIFFLVGLILVIRDWIYARTPQDHARGALLIMWPLVMLAPTALATGGITPSNLRAVGLAPLIALYPALAIVEIAGWLKRFRTVWFQPAIVPASITALLLIGGGFTLRDLVRWGSEQSLYYDNDSPVVALGEYLNAHSVSNSGSYIASFHYRHPTLIFIAKDEPTTRSLFGGDAVVLSPSGETFEAYTRDALPPADWDTWLKQYLVVAPLGPDGTPDFRAYRIPPDARFDVQPQNSANFSNVVVLEGAKFYPTLSGTSATVDLVWRILAPAPAADYAFVGEVCDSFGWCWVKATQDGTLERGVNSTYTSEQWSAGERLLTRMQIPLQQGIPPGKYTVHVSIFSSTANSRLAVIDDQGGFSGLAAEVGPLEITPNASPDLSTVPIQYKLSQKVTNQVNLLGYDRPADTARSGEQLNLALYWLCKNSVLKREAITLRLGDQTLVGGDPVHGTYSTSAWQPGELIVDRYNSRLPYDLPAGSYPLTVQFGSSGPVALGQIAIEAATRNFEPPASMIRLESPVILGSQISLLGYTITDADLNPADTLHLSLVWKADVPISTGYTVFIHIVDSQGKILAQMDRVPFVDGKPYNTDLWQAGEIVSDTYDIPIPSGAIAGNYQIQIGLYLAETGQRLSIPGSADNAIVLPISLVIR